MRLSRLRIYLRLISVCWCGISWGGLLKVRPYTGGSHIPIPSVLGDRNTRERCGGGKGRKTDGRIRRGLLTKMTRMSRVFPQQEGSKTRGKGTAGRREGGRWKSWEVESKEVATEVRQRGRPRWWRVVTSRAWWWWCRRWDPVFSSSQHSAGPLDGERAGCPALRLKCPLSLCVLPRSRGCTLEGSDRIHDHSASDSHSKAQHFFVFCLQAPTKEKLPLNPPPPHNERPCCDHAGGGWSPFPKLTFS